MIICVCRNIRLKGDGMALRRFLAFSFALLYFVSCDLSFVQREMVEVTFISDGEIVQIESIGKGSGIPSIPPGKKWIHLSWLGIGRSFRCRLVGLQG